jgi:ABC-type transport system involved in multi-copper enzyme maturation permease subunit
MTLALNPPGYPGIAWLLFRREVVAKLSSVWFYVVATAVCLMAWVYGAGFQNSFRTESVLVTTDPLMALNILVVAFLGLVLGLRLSASLAWEREHRTLEVLLVGPVPRGAVVLAKFGVELCVLALIMATYWAYLIVAQPLGAGVIGVGDTASVALMPLFTLPVLALGLLVSAWARSVRGAVVIYLVVVGLLLVFEVAHGILAAQPVDQMGLVALSARAALAAAAPLVQPASAVGQLALLTDGLTTQTGLTGLQALGALILTAVTLLIAIGIVRLRGAQE